MKINNPTLKVKDIIDHKNYGLHWNDLWDYMGGNKTNHSFLSKDYLGTLNVVELNKLYNALTSLTNK
jgi:hypothetical protein